MNYLVIDTSGERLLVILRSGGEVHMQYLQNCLTKHSLTLLPEIETALKNANASLGELDFIGAVTGPGSFTGIRIGVATAKALCMSLNKPALGLTTFDVLAYTDKESEKILCLVDAKHGNYYAQTFVKGEKTQHKFLALSEILSDYADYKIISDCAIDFSSLTAKSEALPTAEVADIPRCLLLAADGESKNLMDYELLAPLYVKRSQAEEEACK